MSSRERVRAELLLASLLRVRLTREEELLLRFTVARVREVPTERLRTPCLLPLLTVDRLLTRVSPERLRSLTTLFDPILRGP